MEDGGDVESGREKGGVDGGRCMLKAEMGARGAIVGAGTSSIT